MAAFMGVYKVDQSTYIGSYRWVTFTGDGRIGSELVSASSDVLGILYFSM